MKLKHIALAGILALTITPACHAADKSLKCDDIGAFGYEVARMRDEKFPEDSVVMAMHVSHIHASKHALALQQGIIETTYSMPAITPKQAYISLFQACMRGMFPEWEYESEP